MHLSRALELISVQINCFSCILVTGISLCLSGLLGGRRGDVCSYSVSQMAFFSSSSAKTGPVYPRRQEDGLRVIACYYYNYLFFFSLWALFNSSDSRTSTAERAIFTVSRARTLGASILQGKLSTRCSIRYQLRPEVSTWLTHTDETGTRTWQSRSSGS